MVDASSLRDATTYILGHGDFELFVTHVEIL